MSNRKKRKERLIMETIEKDLSKVDGSNAKIYVAICQHGFHIPKRFAWRWANMLFPRNCCVVCPEPAFDIDLANTRNKMMQAAIDMNCTHILFLDSDNPPTRDMCLKLYSHDKDLVSGIYYIKMRSHNDAPLPVLYNRVKPRFNYEKNCLEQLDVIPMNTLIQVDACGFGCLLIKTDLLRKVADKYKDEKYKWCYIPNPWVTEDIPFCDRVKEVGGEIWIDTSIFVEHLAEYGTGIDDWLELKFLRMQRYGFKTVHNPMKPDEKEEWRAEVSGFDFHKYTREELIARAESINEIVRDKMGTK